MTVYAADADSVSEQAMNLIASWTATLDAADIAGVSEEASRR